jgi:hypothetical protein
VSLVSGPDGDNGSGKNILDARGAEQVIEALDQGIEPLFRQRAHHTGEGLKGVRAAIRFRARRHCAGDHGGAQRALRPMVGRFDPQVVQKALPVAPVVMPAECIEQPLMVGIAQAVERARTRLSAGGLGVRDPAALRKGRCLALPAPCELVDLGAQLDHLALPLNHQRQQLRTTQRRQVFGLTHGRHYKPFV